MSVVIMGESLIDVTTSNDGFSHETPGGSPFNVAIGVSRLLGDCDLLTAIGDDARGRILAECLERDKVRGLFHRLPRTNVARARLDAMGSASYEFDIDASFDITPNMLKVLASADAIHVGSMAAHLRPGGVNIFAAFSEQSGNSLLTYDPNCRPSATPQTLAVRDEVEAFVAATDVVKASEEDMRWLYAGTPTTEVARHWLGLGARVVLVTHGADGIWCRTATGHEVTVAAAPTQMVDSIGAGDSCMAAVIAELVQRGAVGRQARGVLDTLTHEDLRSVLATAAHAAAITCSRAGANPPTGFELAE